jgi:hypothetical protein
MCDKILEKMSKFFFKKKLSKKFSKQFSTKNCQKLANPHCEVSASSFRPFRNMHPPLFSDPPRRRSWLLSYQEYFAAEALALVWRCRQCRDGDHLAPGVSHQEYLAAKALARMVAHGVGDLVRWLSESRSWRHKDLLRAVSGCRIAILYVRS